MTNKTLNTIWSSVSGYNGWLEKLSHIGLSERDLAYLAALDEEFVGAAKDGRWKTILSQKEAQTHFNELFPQKKPLSDKKGTDQGMIDIARDYPIEKLVAVNSRGFASCVWHIDEHPSMFCRNNFAYCFSCGGSGDVIDICMQIHKVGFQEAVRRLQ